MYTLNLIGYSSFLDILVFSSVSSYSSWFLLFPISILFLFAVILRFPLHPQLIRFIFVQLILSSTSSTSSFPSSNGSSNSVTMRHNYWIRRLIYYFLCELTFICRPTLYCLPIGGSICICFILYLYMYVYIHRVYISGLSNSMHVSCSICMLVCMLLCACMHACMYLCVCMCVCIWISSIAPWVGLHCKSASSWRMDYYLRDVWWSVYFCEDKRDDHRHCCSEAD